MLQRLDELLQYCTVKITVPDQVGWGSGFFVAQGLILTCAHVVKGLQPNSRVQISCQQQDKFAEATLVEFPSEKLDLALLRCLSPLNNADSPCVYLGESFKPNDDLYTYGYSDSFPQGISVTGVCEGSAMENGSSLLIFKAAQVRPGLSGSPLLNLRTERVCGIVKFTRDRSFDLGGGATPTNVIFQQFPQLIELQKKLHQQKQIWSDLANLHNIPANLPRSGVLRFVGREEPMAQLHKMLQHKQRVAVSAIAGMGGVGKTELALQYTLKYQRNYLGGICWLSARGTDIGTQIILFCRSLLGLNPPEDLGLTDQVRFCWKNWPSGNILLIFDDVTNYKTIETYLPPETDPRFRVLITTRLQLGASVNQLELEVLSESAALSLLEILVGSKRIQTEITIAKRICELLGYLPLGLELVGRYLARKADLSLIEMLQRLKNKRLAARSLCKTEDDMTAKLGVAAAFELSWELLSDNAKLLGNLISLFAVASIPWPLVGRCLEDEDPEDLEDTRDDELVYLHLLQRTNKRTYRLHPLVRDFFHIKLRQSSLADSLKRAHCQSLSLFAQEALPNLTLASEKFELINTTIPHWISAVTEWQDWLSEEEVVHIYMGLGNFYQLRGLYDESLAWQQKCVDFSQNQMTKEHPYRILSINHLARVYISKGNFSEAITLCEKALEMASESISHSQTGRNSENLLVLAVCSGNLAEAFRLKGDHSKAEPLFIRALDIKKDFYGENHLEVAKGFNNLASLYYSQERYSEAGVYFEKALSIYKRLVGNEHPEISQTLLNLGNTYRAKNLYKKAEPCLKQSLRLREKLFGKSHPLVATSCSALSSLYIQQLRIEEAEHFSFRALEIRRKFLDDTHPDLVISLVTTASVCRIQGLTERSETLLNEALKLARRQKMDKHYLKLVEEMYNNIKKESGKSRKNTTKKRKKKKKKAGKGFAY